MSGPAEPGAFDTELDQNLRHLEDRELVRHRVGSSFAGQQEYAFKHILTRDVAYDTIPLRDRGVAHAQVGEWLEHVAGERAGEFGELLAHHYGTALRLAEQIGAEPDPSLRESAVRWLLRASNDALRKFVLDKAERLAHDALASAEGDVERCDALDALGHAYQAQVRGDLAWQYFVEAAEVAAASDEIPDLRTAHLLALACDQALRWPGTMNVLVPEAEVRAERDRGLALAGPGDSPERANLLAISASWPFAYPESSPGAIDDYAARGLEAVDIAMRLGDANLASGCLDAASSAYCAVGDYRRAMHLFRRRWELRDRITYDLEVVDLHAMGAWISWETGDYPGAVRYGEAIEDWNRHPSTVHAQAWRIAALFRLGRWDEALAAFAQGPRRARQPARQPGERRHAHVRHRRPRPGPAGRAARRRQHLDRGGGGARARAADLPVADPARAPARRAGPGAGRSRHLPRPGRSTPASSGRCGARTSWPGGSGTAVTRSLPPHASTPRLPAPRRSSRRRSGWKVPSPWPAETRSAASSGWWRRGTRSRTSGWSGRRRAPGASSRWPTAGPAGPTTRPPKPPLRSGRSTRWVS